MKPTQLTSKFLNSVAATASARRNPPRSAPAPTLAPAAASAPAFTASSARDYAAFLKWEAERASGAKSGAPAPEPAPNTIEAFIEAFEAEWSANASGQQQRFRGNKENYITYRRWQTGQCSGVARP